MGTSFAWVWKEDEVGEQVLGNGEKSEIQICIDKIGKHFEGQVGRVT